MKRLKSTQEIYGIAPETLRDLSYPEALERKLSGVKQAYAKACQEAEKMYSSGEYGYEQISEQNEWIKYLKKAWNLTELQLEELKPTQG
jgi:hypothetical protein